MKPRKMSLLLQENNYKRLFSHHSTIYYWFSIYEVDWLELLNNSQLVNVCVGLRLMLGKYPTLDNNEMIK